jgi:hypothetical protein
MKPIHFAFFELELLLEGGLPIQDAYDQISSAHSDQEEVESLFKDLSSGFATNDIQLALKPIRDREVENSEYKIVYIYLKIALETGLLDLIKDLGYAFLLKKKLAAAPPTEIDVTLAKHLLDKTGMSVGDELDTEFLTWSSAPMWQEIEHREFILTEFPAAWWNSISTDGPAYDSPLLTLPAIRKSLENAATLDKLPHVTQEWEQFTRAYLALEK